jgi:hypothetical protein
MTHLKPEQQILLHEYQQAGEMCRNHDQLLRTGLVIFGAIQAAIIGFIGTRKDGGLLELFVLELFGFWLSVIVLLTTLRLGYRYQSYMERAKCIEHRLGMYLFNCSQEFFAFAEVPAKRLGNKRSWASVPILSMWLYVALIVSDGKKNAEAFLCRLGL